MSIKHIVIAGLPLTEATYMHEGKECCARLIGHHTAEEVADYLERMRKAAATVVYP